MAPKRKTDASQEETTAREKKKMKVTVARTIAVQPVKAVTFSDNAVAGPSSGPVNSERQELLWMPLLTLFVQGMERLPGAIDVEKFAEVVNLSWLHLLSLKCVCRRELSRLMLCRVP